MSSDLEIDIDFDTQDFLISSYDEEFPIITDNTIRFLGEDLILQK